MPGRIILAIWVFAGLSLPAQVINNWSNPGSGSWEDASSWSLGIRPAWNQTVAINNGGYKAVGISSSTSSSFPASMTVSNLSISAPASALSVLLLNYAGTSVPLHVLDVCSIGANGSLQNFYSSLQVDGSNGVFYGGSFLIADGGQLIQEGGLTVITPTIEVRNGTINATNATMNLGTLNFGDTFNGTSGNVSQSGGTVLSGGLRMDIGSYTLLGGGTLYALDKTILYEGSAGFNQISGSNYGDVQVNAGHYHFYDGLMQGNDLSTTGSGGFVQDGGTAEFATVEVQGDNSYTLSYTLNGGALRCRDLYITGLLQHWGGTLTLTNGLSLGIGRVELRGGTASMPSMTVSNSGSYIQYSGTNQIAGDLALYNAQFVLWSGRLASANLGVAGGALLIQYGGSEEVSGVLSIVGSYLLNGGVLSVNGMYLRGTLSIAQGGSPPASFVNSGLINFGGTLNIAASQNSMGQLGLSTNGTINLQSSPLVVRFADSHALNWDSSSTLTIAGWNGSYYGNGSNQVYFGSSSSGLTASQLARIQFSNPGGYDPGNYSAQLLSSGELVPAVAPGPPPETVNIWTNPASGNWEDLKWSLGIRPAPGQTIMITNQGWKAVAIGTNTVQNFPQTLSVSNVVLGGYTDSFNVLLLNYAGFAVPLTIALMTVGTNSGVTTLGSILNVSSNSGPGSLSIFSAFNQGDQAIVNAHTINLGNVTNSAAGPGIYNQTNGTINADEISEAFSSTFNQFNGSNTVGTLWMGANSTGNHGEYNMVNGYLTAGIIELYRGNFYQTGGSVTAGVGLGDATYTLSAGTLRMPGITIPGVECSMRNPCPNSISGTATLLQTGGTNFCNGSLTVFDEHSSPVGSDFIGPGHYVLSNGVLYVSSAVRSGYYGDGGDFQQWGGWHTNAGTVVSGDTGPNFVIKTSSFRLGGGTLITPSISIALGDFTQSGGTNYVSGEVELGTDGSLATFTLSGGLLTDSTTFVDGSNNATPGGQPAVFTQSGGTHIVTNLLWLSGRPPGAYEPPNSVTAYVLSNGMLNAANIRIDGGAFFEHDGGALTTSGLFTLGRGAWKEKTTGQQFGQLLLNAPAGSNANFSLPSGNCIVHFANSSAQAWNGGAMLSISNWHGSPSGGGASQLYFGSNSSGLTAQQLAQIQFAISGTNYPAAILATGEVVPNNGGTVTNSTPMLQAARNGNTLTLQWGPGWVLQSSTNVTGPFQDVSGATNPWPVSMTKPREFFRLRSNNGAANFANDANTVALYHFDSTNTPFADSSGHGYTLSSHGNVVLANNATWMGSPTGLVARFSAVGDYLELTSIPDASVLPTNSSPLTIETRIYPRAYQSSTAAYLVELYQDFDTFWTIYTPGTSNPNIPQVYGPIASIMLSATDWSQLVTLNTWHSIKITVAANGISQLYIDGTLAGSSNVSPNYGRTNNWTLHLGDFNGDLDEVRISNIVR